MINKKLSVIPQPQPPSVWPPRKELDATIRSIDRVVSQFTYINDAMDLLRKYPSNVDALNGAKYFLENYASSSVCKMVEGGGLEVLRKESYPSFWYNDDDDPKK